MVLDYVALVAIFFLLIMITFVIVQLGSLPGKIARRRGHPWPDAVNAASWIGLATGVFWPLAFIWAFLPLPAVAGSPDAPQPSGVEDRILALEATIEKLQQRDVESEGAS